MPDFVYGDLPETPIYKNDKVTKRAINYILLGTALKVKEETTNWYKVSTLGKGKSGWVQKSDIRDVPAFKIFLCRCSSGRWSDC